MLHALLSGRARLTTHVVGWFMVALLFYSLISGLRGPVEGFYRTALNMVFLLALFYGNAKIVVNRYFETGRYGLLIVITLERLNNLEKTLPPTHFLRVHKSYIVCRDRVQQLDGDALLIGQARIPVARSRKRAVVEALFL